MLTLNILESWIIWYCKWKQIILGDDSTHNCGRFEKANSRIWKGQDTIDNTRYPFQIFLVINWKYPIGIRPDGFCGGALYTWKHVVTAAHCMERKERNRTRDNVNGVAIAGLNKYENYRNYFFGNKDIGNSQRIFFTAKDVKVHPRNVCNIQ